MDGPEVADRPRSAVGDRDDRGGPGIWINLSPEAEQELLTEFYDSREEFARLADGRWAYVPPLVSGRLVTHRLTNPEIVHDVLTITPDLVLLLAFRSPVSCG